MAEGEPVAGGTELAPGAVVGRYVIGGLLGRGGMGVVYDAHDPELDRRVALKVLSEVLDESPLAQARLRREAQALAKLSHPNVVAVHDVGTHGDRIFLAMERVDGVTLTAWLAEQPRSWREIVAVFRQAGEGLAAAHAAGLIHRDFKPDNVIVERTGRARVLDFGLARAADATGDVAAASPVLIDRAALLSADTVSAETTAPSSGVATDGALARTQEAASGAISSGAGASGKLLASPLTATGTLLGTPLYMSSEQHLRGPIDARTDQFSFCVALHEALYGQRPFRGETLFQIRQSVLRGAVAPPPRGTLVPERIRRAMLRGLRVAPADRFPSMEALLAELVISEPRPSRRTFIAGAAGAIALAAAGAVLVARSLRATARAAPVRFQQLTFNGASNPLLSPDGRHLLYNSRQKLIVRDLTTGNDTTLGDEGWFTHWTSNDEVAALGISKEMLAIPVGGGAPRPLPFESVRSPDGSRILEFRLFSKEIIMTEVATGAKRTLPLGSAFTWLYDVTMSPRGDLLLLCTENEGQLTLSTMALDGSPRRDLVNGIGLGLPCFAPRGDAIYYIRGVLRAGGDGDLVKLRIDPRSGAAVGPPEVILSGLSAGSRLAVSPDGQRLFFTRGLPVGHLWAFDLPAAGGARKPRLERITTSSRYRQGLALSPDGKEALVSEVESEVTLMAITLDGGAERRIASIGDFSEVELACSPDGAEIALTAVDRQQSRAILQRVPAAGGLPRPLDLIASQDVAWAPCPQILVQMDGNQNFHVVDPATSRARPLLPATDGWLFDPRVSPDGKSAAFHWNRKLVEPGDGLWLVTIENGNARLLAKGQLVPAGFTPDGTSVYAIDSGERLVAIAIATGTITPLADLALPGVLIRMMTVPGTSRFVCLVSEGGPDLWMAEGFDPEA